MVQNCDGEVNGIDFKTPRNIRQLFLGPIGGLKPEGPLHTCIKSAKTLPKKSCTSMKNHLVVTSLFCCLYCNIHVYHVTITVWGKILKHVAKKKFFPAKNFEASWKIPKLTEKITSCCSFVGGH